MRLTGFSHIGRLLEAGWSQGTPDWELARLGARPAGLGLPRCPDQYVGASPAPLPPDAHLWEHLTVLCNPLQAAWADRRGGNEWEHPQVLDIVAWLLMDGDACRRAGPPPPWLTITALAAALEDVYDDLQCDEGQERPTVMALHAVEAWRRERDGPQPSLCRPEWTTALHHVGSLLYQHLLKEQAGIQEPVLGLLRVAEAQGWPEAETVLRLRAHLASRINAPLHETQIVWAPIPDTDFWSRLGKALRCIVEATFDQLAADLTAIGDKLVATAHEEPMDCARLPITRVALESWEEERNGPQRPLRARRWQEQLHYLAELLALRPTQREEHGSSGTQVIMEWHDTSQSDVSMSDAQSRKWSLSSCSGRKLRGTSAGSAGGLHACAGCDFTDADGVTDGPTVKRRRRTRKARGGGHQQPKPGREASLNVPRRPAGGDDPSPPTESAERRRHSPNPNRNAEAVCTYAITCSLCGTNGHRYRHCPYSTLNADISVEDLSQANIAAQCREQEDRQQRAAEQAAMAEARWREWALAKDRKRQDPQRHSQDAWCRDYEAERSGRRQRAEEPRPFTSIDRDRSQEQRAGRKDGGLLESGEEGTAEGGSHRRANTAKALPGNRNRQQCAAHDGRVAGRRGSLRNPRRRPRAAPPLQQRPVPLPRWDRKTPAHPAVPPQPPEGTPALAAPAANPDALGPLRAEAAATAGAATSAAADEPPPVESSEAELFPSTPSGLAVPHGTPEGPGVMAHSEDRGRHAEHGDRTAERTMAGHQQPLRPEAEPFRPRAQQRPPLATADGQGAPTEPTQPPTAQQPVPNDPPGVRVAMWRVDGLGSGVWRRDILEALAVLRADVVLLHDTCLVRC
ncbi:UNVERIFIED_CONTAM: hypothetical protein K2H54_038117 [Gekko kuhli]